MIIVIVHDYLYCDMPWCLLEPSKRNEERKVTKQIPCLTNKIAERQNIGPYYESYVHLPVAENLYSVMTTWTRTSQ